MSRCIIKMYIVLEELQKNYNTYHLICISVISVCHKHFFYLCYLSYRNVVVTFYETAMIIDNVYNV